jgi:hypothetical protein
VVAGEEPFALFEGVGTNQGPTRLVSLGDGFEGYVLTAIRGDTAIVADGDREWAFTLERPWG